MPTQPDNVTYNKAAIIERSLRRVRQEHEHDPDLSDFTHIDALTLNLERACQAAIDLALHVVALRHLGIPQRSAESFSLLQSAGLLTAETTRAMVAMTGFRNIAVHEYQELDIGVLRRIAEHDWRHLVTFCHELGVRIEP